MIEQALAVNWPDADDPIDVLCKVGGFDLCAMTGVFLGAAHARLPVVVDGFISIVAALCAARLCENARGFFFGSHVSYERGYKIAEQLLGLQPCLQLGMRLGEGSGCPLAFRVIEAACAVISTMATFPEAAIDDTYLTEIRERTVLPYELLSFRRREERKILAGAADRLRPARPALLSCHHDPA